MEIKTNRYNCGIFDSDTNSFVCRRCDTVSDVVVNTLTEVQNILNSGFQTAQQFIAQNFTFANLNHVLDSDNIQLDDENRPSTF